MGTEPTTVKELGIRTHHCLKSLGSEPTTVKELGIGTHYCCYCVTLGIGIHLALENPSTPFSFVFIVEKLYITALCASCLFGSILVHSDLA